MSGEEQLRFWAWFEGNAAALSARTPKTITELGERLERLGIESWEIGPSDEDHDVSILSIGLTDEAAKSTGELMLARAPHVSGWKFQVGHPRKHWDGHVHWGPEQVPVNTLSWRFLVFKYPDGMHEIALVRPPLEPTISDQAEALAIFAVEAELGQAEAERLICKITVDDGVPLDRQAMLMSLKDLRKAVGLPE